MLTASLNNMKNAYYFTELMVTRLGRSGHSLNIKYLLQKARLHRAAYLFIYQIRYRDAWIVFSEKGHRPKFVKRKWKIENNDKEELQFQTLRKTPTWRVYEERKSFPPRVKKRC